MIDLGLSKLALIGVVALVVIGPERLPRVARMAGSLLGRAQRYMNEIKSEVSREIELEELRKMQTDMRQAVSEAEHTIAQNVSQVEKDLHSGWDSTLYDQENLPLDLSRFSAKTKSFRKKKLARTSAIPSWYKRQSGHKTHVISGAARVARYRLHSRAGKSFH